MVTRFFGGVKLGTGGLVRAYGGAARACLRDAPKKEISKKLIITVSVPFDCIGVAYQSADHVGARRIEETYESETEMRLQLEVDVGAVEVLRQMLADTSGGRITIIVMT